MGIYKQFICPRLLNAAMSGKEFAPYRAEVLQSARGKVLEVGFGSGLNLPYYPRHISEIHTVEVNQGMQQLALKNIANSAIPVNYHTLNAEQLPFPNAYFDTVVSTWTLCSIKNVHQALSEMYRVLQPQGQFLFVEHGLSPEARVQKWQHRFTPIQKFIADGCHLNCDIEALIAAAGFKFIALRKEYALSPKIAGYFYIGIASK